MLDIVHITEMENNTVRVMCPSDRQMFMKKIETIRNCQAYGDQISHK